MKSYKEISKEELSFLIQEAQSGNILARNQIIESYQGFVLWIAKGFYNPALELMDLVQEGNICLIKAIETFDESKKVLFSTYANRVVRFGMLNAIETKASVIKAPKGWIGRKNKWKTEKDSYSKLVRDNRRAVANAVYSMAPLGGAEGVSDPKIRPDKIVESEMDQANLKAALDRISPREYTIIRMHYGLDGEGTKPLRGIGTFLGVTGSRIMIIERNIIKKLRLFMENGCLIPIPSPERSV